MDHKRLVVLVFLVVAGLTPCVSALGQAASYASPDGTFEMTAASLEIGEARVVATGQAKVSGKSADSKASFEASAPKIVVTMSPAKANGSGFGSVGSAEMTGPVKIVYKTTGASGNVTVTTATADHATYDGATEKAVLDGNVRVISEDPTMFAQPAVMTGDKATVNLARNLRPDQFRFKIESHPGLSRIEVTPKKRTQAGK